MKAYNAFFGALILCIWIYSLRYKWGIAINILLGILAIFIFFFDDLLYKPINLVGWEIKKDEEGKNE